MTYQDIDTRIVPSDDDCTRAFKDLLNYGGHKEECDRSNEDGPEDQQHICCSCGWCVVADWAYFHVGGSVTLDRSIPNCTIETHRSDCMCNRDKE